MKYFKSYIYRKAALLAASSTLCLCFTPLLLNNFETKQEPPLKDELEMKKQKCKELIKRYKDEYGVPGIVVGVTINGQSVYKKGFGYSDVENNVKADEDTVMRIASISKPITCVIAAKIIENGQLDLDKSVNQYIKALPKFKWNDQEVILTPRFLMSHTSGIRHYEKDVNLDEKEKASKAALDTVYQEFYIKEHFENVEDSLSIFINDKLLFKPGTNYMYSTHAFTLLSFVLEKTVNRKFSDLLNDMFKYIKMNNTFLDENDPIIPNRSKFYQRDDNKKLKNVPYVDNSYKWAGGGLLSNVGDLLKFANHLLICYQTNQATNFLKQETIRKYLWSKQSTCKTKYANDVEILPLVVPIENVSYGLGWVLCFDEKKNLKYVYHTGGAMGCVSCLLISPESELVEKNKPNGIAVAVFCNASEANGIAKLALNIANIFSGKDL